MNKIFSLSFVLLFSRVFCQRKDVLPKTESLYASSLFRMNQGLEGGPRLESLENISSVSICLLNCMKRKPDCKSFNWGNGECVLMSDSVCFNETLLLTRKEGYAYYDIMDSPDFEVGFHCFSISIKGLFSIWHAKYKLDIICLEMSKILILDNNYMRNRPCSKINPFHP